MQLDEIVHVAIAPPHPVEVDLIKQVAAVIKKDLYGTRLLLSGKIPRIIARYKSMQTAELAANSLRRLGLVAFVYRDADLHKTLRSFRAYKVKFGQQEALFSDRTDKVLKIAQENMFLIIEGKMQTQTEKEVTSTRTKINLPATLLTGGIPIWRGVKEKTRETSVETEYFLRLHTRNASEPVVEIFQYDFDYSFLGDKIALSSLSNFDTLVLKMREAFPQSVFDKNLTELFATNDPATSPADSIEINCRLIYLYYLATSGG